MTILGKRGNVGEKARELLLLNTLTELLAELRLQTKTQKEFINVITNFFAIEKKLRIEEARRREADELEKHATEGDWKF